MNPSDAEAYFEKVYPGCLSPASQIQGLFHGKVLCMSYFFILGAGHTGVSSGFLLAMCLHVSPGMPTFSG